VKNIHGTYRELRAIPHRVLNLKAVKNLNFVKQKSPSR
jgi:hypothetical protein